MPTVYLEYKKAEIEEFLRFKAILGLFKIGLAIISAGYSAIDVVRGLAR